MLKEGVIVKLYHLLGLIPFIMILGFSSWANHVKPIVLGMPFLLFWVVLWTVLSSLIMWIIFKLDSINKGGTNKMNISLIIIFFFLAVSIYLGIQARKGKDMNLEQWTVGGREFGTIFVFLLMAGEIYTTFTFLGGSGWAYGKGGPTYYIIAYGSLAYIMSYWLLPKIWKYAKENKLMSQPDFLPDI